jgi:DNA-3-methyladenine glycosylase I
MTMTRCAWVANEPLYQHYHDHEWGVAIDDDRLLFEFLMLEGMQAGLSWLTILKKRENYRACFDQFVAEAIVTYDENKFNALMENPGIIRNRLKIQAIIRNAHAFLQVKQTQGSFADYLWSFVDGQPIQNHWQSRELVPTRTVISDRLAADLKKRGFTFVGSTICYAFMQAVGMVNDHTTDCFRYKVCAK